MENQSMSGSPALCIPHGAIHRFDKNRMQDAKALCMIAPAAICPQYFRDAAEVSKAAAGAPPDRNKDVGSCAPLRPNTCSASAQA